MHLAFERRLALSRVAMWQEELDRGRRPCTPQLLAAIAGTRR
jgi:hypothetical protein